ncbi:hypothetical protein LSH36_669g01023 [Paralvinella palmiformis]|uniref:Cullin family profile domain-containing protein n=1 Tax=Paralvinella palmiformis TaxID=53620 RepID=A0AAD9MTV2_9ANNE|nr:hypothetical protein LSH36_669g01023 [Paralvinella palmiformis]
MDIEIQTVIRIVPHDQDPNPDFVAALSKLKSTMKNKSGTSPSPLTQILVETMATATTEIRAALGDPEVVKSQPFPSDRDPEAVYANNELCLDDIDVYGFDYDYTLAFYGDALHDLIYNMGRETLVKQLKYPSEILTLDFNPKFAVRGLHCDVQTGFLLKIDAFHNIQMGTVYRGLEPVPDDEVYKSYNGTHVPIDEMSTFYGTGPKMRQLMDLFALSEMSLFSNVIQYFITNKIAYDPGYVFHDVTKTVKGLHYSGVIHAAILNDIERFITKQEVTKELLHRLVAAGKQLFLITNSGVNFVNQGMTYLVGKDWAQLFNVIITGARKPKFFYETKSNDLDGTEDEVLWDEQHDKSDTDSDEEGKNMYGDMMTYEQIQQMFNEDSDDDDEFLGFESILLISVHLIRLFDLHASIYGLESPGIFVEGNFSKLSHMTGWTGSRVLYFGDHVYTDLADVTLNHGWRTGAIIPELEDEIYIINSDVFKKAIIWLTTLERLIDKSQVYDDPESLAVLADWLKERDQLRLVTKNVFNPQFGSLFRTYHNPTYFTRRLNQYADIYTSSITNLAKYSLSYTFYPHRTALPHELDDTPLNFDLLT